MKAEELARLAAGAGLDKKALDPVIIDLRGLTSVADYFVILTGTSDRHVQAVAENVMEAFSALGHPLLGVEGLKEGSWVLLDFVEVVVHVFQAPVRERFDFERLWSDAPRVEVEEEGTAGE